jgi:glycosyltransferase involved in cell wall biosynthesis
MAVAVVSKDKINVAWLSQRYIEGDSCFPGNTRVMDKLSEQNFNLAFIYLGKSSSAPNILETLGYKVTYLRQSRAMKVLDSVTLWKLIRYLRDNPTDILHCHRHKATLYGSLAAWVAGVPVVFAHVHGLKRTRTILRRFTNRIIHNKVTNIIAVSDAVREDVIAFNPSLPREKVLTIRNSIDVDKFSHVRIGKQEARTMLGLPKESIIFGTVGRLVPTKGQSYLIDAFARVRRSVSNAHLVFVGEGPLESILRHQAADLGCLDVTTFTGQRSDIPILLRAFDCFLLPSIAEGLGLSLLEAMAASLPCIASNIGGIPEIIINETLGHLVPAKDPEALAEAMMNCVDASEDARHEMGRAASALVKTSFSTDIYVKRIQQLYETALSEKKGKSCLITGSL